MLHLNFKAPSHAHLLAKSTTPPFSPIHVYLSKRSLQQLNMLVGMRLLHIRLSHLLHHEIRINVDFLAKLAVRNAPLARDSQDADGRLSVDK